MFRIFSLALAALALTPAPAFAKLSPAETRMIRTVDAEQERTLAMLEKWVNQNSGSLNIEGVTRVGEMLRAELEPLGFHGRVDRHARRPAARVTSSRATRAMAAASACS